jgi:hypothetical protein
VRRREWHPGTPAGTRCGRCRGGGVGAQLRRRGRSRRQGRRGGDKERSVPFFIFRRPFVASRSDSTALPPGCPPGLLASFSLAWRDYPPDISSHSHHSLIQTLCIRALFPLPVTLLYFRSFSALLRPRTIPFRFVLSFLPPFPSAASRFPPGAVTPLRPITEGGSLCPPIGAEAAFPARGMLAQFSHAFAGGRFSPSRAPSDPVSPSREGAGGVVALPPHTQAQFTSRQM